VVCTPPEVFGLERKWSMRGDRPPISLPRVVRRAHGKGGDVISPLMGCFVLDSAHSFIVHMMIILCKVHMIIKSCIVHMMIILCRRGYGRERRGNPAHPISLIPHHLGACSAQLCRTPHLAGKQDNHKPLGCS
jgi:hypothetical protein